MTPLFDDFHEALDTRWTQTCMSGGELTQADSLLCLRCSSARQGQYTDAQIDDYGRLQRSHFPWRPPLRMEVRARSSLPAASPTGLLHATGMLRGTAGFGFWNYPFSLRGDALMLPEAVWFFYASPPSNMALVPGMPGWGWKAQVVHSMRVSAIASAFPLALTAAYGLVTGDPRPASRWMQRASGASEAILNVAMDVWHTYTLEWSAQEAVFYVDGNLVLRASEPPARALGFVAWLDNQYAVATPRDLPRFGTIDCGPQQLELDYVKIEPL